MIQYGVTALEKDPAILCGLRLVLNHPGGSEPINITLAEYLESPNRSRICADDPE